MEWYDFALFGAATTIRAAVLAPGGFAVDRRPLGPGRSAAVLAATICTAWNREGLPRGSAGLGAAADANEFIRAVWCYG